MFIDDYTKGNRIPSKTLFWEYNFDKVMENKEKNKALIVSRIISHGLTEDWYAGFDMYGIDGFGQIAKNEVREMRPINLNFVCYLFGFKKEETLCYTRKQLRRQLLNS